jgi:hypothetical protein
MATVEKPKYYVVSATDRLKELKPLELEVKDGVYTTTSQDAVKAFKVTDYVDVAKQEQARTGKPLTAENPLSKLPAGSIIAAQKGKVYHLKTEPLHDANNEEFWNHMDAEGGPLNDSEKKALELIIGDYAIVFRFQDEREGSPIYRALTMDGKDGGTPTKAEIIERLKDPELPLERIDEVEFFAAMNRVIPGMNDVQRTFATDLIKAMKTRHSVR